MKILLAILITVYICTRQLTNSQSCVAAGYSGCCIGNSCNTTGGCYCDHICYSVGDCCIDIRETCSGQSCVEAGHSGCCIGNSCNTTAGCYCDHTCYSIGDCCIDINETCSEQSSSTGLEQTTTNEETELTTEQYRTTQLSELEQTTMPLNEDISRQLINKHSPSTGLEQTTTNKEPELTTEQYRTTQLSQLEQTTMPLNENISRSTKKYHITVSNTGHEQIFIGMKPREVAAWVLMTTFTLLFVGSLTLSIIVSCICIKKTENSGQATEYELDNNPCYEASKVTHTAESTNFYEAV